MEIENRNLADPRRHSEKGHALPANRVKFSESPILDQSYFFSNRMNCRLPWLCGPLFALGCSSDQNLSLILIRRDCQHVWLGCAHPGCPHTTQSEPKGVKNGLDSQYSTLAMKGKSSAISIQDILWCEHPSPACWQCIHRCEELSSDFPTIKFSKEQWSFTNLPNRGNQSSPNQSPSHDRVSFERRHHHRSLRRQPSLCPTTQGSTYHTMGTLSLQCPFEISSTVLTV